MKISTAAILALSLLGGAASAMTHSSLNKEVQFAYTEGNVSVNVQGETAILSGHVDSVSDARNAVQAALANGEVNEVINLISIR